MRMNRWSKNSVLNRVFVALQEEGIINITVDVICLDSTTVKVHPDACGALKKEEDKQSACRAAILQRQSTRYALILFYASCQAKTVFVDGQSL